MPPRSERFELRIDEEQLGRIDAWAGEQSDHLTRAEAFRRLIDIGLATASSRSVRFSDGEKILILMMGDLFKRLEVQGEINADFLADVIYEGHYWAPKWEMQGVFHNDVDDPADVDYVVKVLSMWSFIEQAYEKFTPEERQQVEEKVGVTSGQVAFSGFDGNEETRHYRIATFLTTKMRRFRIFKDRDLNSHDPTHERYQRMLELFEPIRGTLIRHGLDVQQVIKLLKA